MKLDIKTYSELHPKLVNWETKEIDLGCINGHSPMMDDFRISLSHGCVEGTFSRTSIGRCLDSITYNTNVYGDVWKVTYTIDSSD